MNGTSVSIFEATLLNGQPVSVKTFKVELFATTSLQITYPNRLIQVLIARNDDGCCLETYSGSHFALAISIVNGWHNHHGIHPSLTVVVTRL